MKNLTTRLAVLLLSTLSLLTGAFAQFTPSQDSYTFNNKVNQNYGTAQAISVEYSVIAHPPAIENSYIQFDLSSIPSSYTGANVSKASLKLFVNFLSGAGGSFNVDLVNGSWTELGIKYNNAPALGTTIASSIPLTTANVNDYVIVDVTSAVQAWLDGSQSNDGIALVANSGLGVLFDSKENTATSHPPELDIVFASGGTITGITTTGSSGLIGGGTTGNLNLSLIPCSASQPILVWNGSGWSCSTVSGGGGSISGSGTVNSLSLFNGTTSLASSNVFQSGTNIGIGNPTPLAALDVTGAVNATTSFQIGGVPFGYGSSPAGNAFLGFAGNSNSNNTGQLNTAVGDLALFTNTTGQNNAASGAFALENNTTGNGNTASGVFALGLNTTGSNNSALGYFAGSDLITTLVNNATAIGAFADVTQSNSLVLGGITGMNGCTAQNNCASVRVGIGTTAPQYTLDVNGTANFTGAVNFANSTVGSSTVFGNNTATSGFGTNGGSFSTASSAGTGVVGQNFSGGGGDGGFFSSASASGIGVVGQNTSGGLAGYFQGGVTVTGTETVGGNLTASGVVTGSGFQIGSNLFDFGSYASENSFVGFAGNSNPANTGVHNTATGALALLGNTTGSYNTASGRASLGNNTTGIENTATGDAALDYNISGGSNTAIGVQALYDNTGSNNTGLGTFAGDNSTPNQSTGSNNTFVGYSAGPGAQTYLFNSTALGANAEVTEDNALVLGSIAGLNGCDPSATPACQSAKVGIGTTAPQATLDVESPSATTPPTVTFGSASIPAIFTLNGSANFIGAATFGSSVGFLSTQTFPNTVSAVTAGIGLMGGGTGNVTLSLPTCPITQVLQSTGGGWTCATVSGGGGGGIGGSGTVNSLPLFSTATSVASSNVYQSSTNTNIGIGTTTPQVALDVNGTINASALNLNGQTFAYTSGSGGANAFLGFAGQFASKSSPGYFNTAVGFAALNNNGGSGGFSVSSNNTAVGSSALLANTTGASNTASGFDALYNNTTGSNNTAVGYNAGSPSVYEDTTGSNNTFLGASSGPGTQPDLSYATAIGANSIVSQPNALVLGSILNMNGCTSPCISTNVGIGTATPGATLDVEAPSGTPAPSVNFGSASNPASFAVTGTTTITGNLNVNGTCTGCGGSGGGGTITGVTAGTGLKGGGMSGNVTLTLDPSATNTFTGTQTFNNGILASISSNSNAGISGSNNSALGPGAGVAGFSASGSGSGVVGTNSSQSLGGGYGVQGLSYNTADPGVGGINNAPNGSAYGVWGQSLSSTGTGVYGTGNATGVTGSATGSGTGVYGTGGNIGVTGSAPGTGVFGLATATIGTASGVVGQSNSPGGTGVTGLNSSAGGNGVSGQGFTGVNGAGAGSGVTGTSTSSTGSGVVGIMNSGGGYAGFFQGDVAVTGNATVAGTLAIGGDTAMSHSPRMTFSGSVASFTTSPQAAGYFIPDQPIVITRFTVAVGGGQNSLCSSPEFMSLTINGNASAATVEAEGMPDSTSFTASGPLNIPVSAGTPIYMYGNSASGLGCQSGNNITATVEYAMQ